MSAAFGAPAVIWILSVVLGQPGSSPESADSVPDLTARSEMVLWGTVRILDGSTVNVEPDDAKGLAVVRLDEVIVGPDLLKSFVGKDITVRLKQPTSVKPGEGRVFFADSWIFADGVAVVEVGSHVRERAATAAALSGEVASSVRETSDRELKSRLDATPLVVAGRVAAVTTNQRPLLSEHDPQWSTAEVRVTEVLKGSAQETVTVAFPGSVDVMWYRVPKLKTGQEGVFLLESGLTGLESAQPGITEPQDVLPASELARVKALLKKP